MMVLLLLSMLSSLLSVCVCVVYITDVYVNGCVNGGDDGDVVV